MKDSVKKERSKAAESLISFDRDIKEIRENLAKFGWDCDEELVTFGKEHARSVLKRYLTGELSEDAIEDWANAMECREEIGFENELLRELIFELANPILTDGPLTYERANEWMKMIEKDSGE